MRVRVEIFGWTSPQSNENPPPATTTAGLPAPVQYRWTLYPPTSTSVPSGAGLSAACRAPAESARTATHKSEILTAVRHERRQDVSLAISTRDALPAPAYPVPRTDGRPQGRFRVFSRRATAPERPG